MFNLFSALDFGGPELLIAAVLLAVFVFEVVMFVSAARNPYISTNAKVLWLIGMLFIHPFVAIVYFFTDYKKAA